jgi:hypothetical protein
MEPVLNKWRKQNPRGQDKSETNVPVDVVKDLVKQKMASDPKWQATAEPHRTRVIDNVLRHRLSGL